jgi:hypothetical protein
LILDQDEIELDNMDVDEIEEENHEDEENEEEALIEGNHPPILSLIKMKLNWMIWKIV